MNKIYDGQTEFNTLNIKFEKKITSVFLDLFIKQLYNFVHFTNILMNIHLIHNPCHIIYCKTT